MVIPTNVPANLLECIGAAITFQIQSLGVMLAVLVPFSLWDLICSVKKNKLH